MPPPVIYFSGTEEQRQRIEAYDAALAQVQFELLREIIGNPFRKPTFDLGWRTLDAVALARDVYAERAFDRLPILAEYLQRAGCEDEQLLGHCRRPGRHVRGCWVLDLVLGLG